MMLNKIPTGIKTFDMNINEGFPAGSVILLLEDIGAGAREFVYTSIFNINRMKSDDKFNFTKDYKMVGSDEITAVPILPENICYISVSKSLDDILKENAYSFRKDFYKAFQKVIFKDLSEIYFRHSMTKNFWTGEKGITELEGSNKNIFEEISEFLNKNAENNIVIVDSLTDLMLHDADYIDKNDIIMFLKSITRASKLWNGLIYVMLGANIIDSHTEEIINDVVDGVLVFEWFDKGSTKMRRDLHISKFRGLIPRLEQNKVAKFETKVTYDDGFEVSNVRKII